MPRNGREIIPPDLQTHNIETVPGSPDTLSDFEGQLLDPGTQVRFIRDINIERVFMRNRLLDPFGHHWARIDPLRELDQLRPVLT